MLAIFKRGKKQRMAKNAPKRGKSMRNGNMPSPYTKYKKVPYKYNFLKKKEHNVQDIKFSKKEYKKSRNYIKEAA